MRNLILATLLSCSAAASADAQLPRVAANDNRVPAGVVRNGTLTLQLEITAAMMHPDADAAAGFQVNAIAVAGQRPSVPAPLIRVPRGTVVRTSLRNTLKESMMVWGLGGSHSLADSVRLEPGETREFTLNTEKPGNYLYGAWRNFRTASPENPQAGVDMMGSGAFIVDEPGERKPDRVFVLHMVADTNVIARRHGLTSIIATINGKSWPHTEQITQNVGDTMVWRVVNASIIPHPMHLHGFYFDVLSRGTFASDTIYSEKQVRKAVTERMLPMSTMTMRWVPERPGNWLFHCHLTAHTQLHGPLGPMKASGSAPHIHDAKHGMSNLILGVVVRGTPARDGATRRKLRLAVDQLDSIPGEVTTRFQYTLDGRSSGAAAGPVIVLNRNEPSAITVVNQAATATAVHWHGIELESFNDGVAGFGGHGTRITPLIAAGDSFVARMTPPRAGTFIYHTHVDELRQQRGGLYGALLVVDPAKYDPATERVIVLGSAADTSGIYFNGAYQPTMEVEVGKTYRIRFVQIMTARPAMYVALMNDRKEMEEWTLVAKDGADLPAHQLRTVPARVPLSNGETYDVLYTPRAPGELTLEARANNNTVFGKMTLVAR
jgi:FtsP/CotA-like multicopper oxidase with cupredoxin domain